MELNDRFRRNIRIFYGWLGSTVLLGASQVAALLLIQQETTFARAAAVAIGVLGMLPWMAVLIVIIRHGDEYERRMHLIAIAIAAGASVMLLVTLGWLSRAWFIEPPDLMVVWFAFLVLWFVALVGTKRYFERTP